MNKISVTKEDYVVMEVDVNKYTAEKTLEIFKYLKQNFPNNKCIAIPVGCKLEAMDKEKLIQLIENM